MKRPIVVLVGFLAFALGVASEAARRPEQVRAHAYARELAEKKLAEVEKNLADLRQSYAETRKALRGKELLIAMAEDQGVSFCATHGRVPVVPMIHTSVVRLEENVSPPLVWLAVGSEDGVKADLHFSIYRPSIGREDEFVGKVVVAHVGSDRCVARLLFTKEGARVQSGDRAATRLD